MTPELQQALANANMLPQQTPDQEWGSVTASKTPEGPRQADPAVVALNMKGHNHAEAGRYDLALEYFRKALRKAPGNVGLICNIGAVFQAIGRYDDAERLYRIAYEADKESGRPSYLLGMMCLMQGKYEEGWCLHETRWKTISLGRPCPAPVWYGPPRPTPRHIVLRCEQGVGDTLHFIRYAPLLQERFGSRVTVEVQPSIVRLCKTMGGGVNIMANDEPWPDDMDAFCPLMSCPIIFRGEMPARLPYFHVEPKRLTVARVGLCWRGNPEQSQDIRRSIPRALLQSSFAPSVPMVSLVKPVEAPAPLAPEMLAPVPEMQLENEPADVKLRRAAQAKYAQALHASKETPPPAWLEPMPPVGDYLETAELVKGLDLVISVCTSVGHLAGALGVPTWTLLRADPCWRWLRDRRDTPWYPGMRLFRQPSHIKGWLPVLRDVRSELERFVACQETVQ